MSNPDTHSPGIETGEDEMKNLLRRQKQAYLSDGYPDLALRLDRLDRLASLLATNSEHIADAISQDFGSHSREASLFYDVVALLESIKHTRAHLAHWMDTEVYSPPYPGTAAHVAFQPKGVIGVVSPWNFPVQLAFGPVIGVLGAGNRAILKPSELTPVTSELMRQLVAGSFDELELAVVTGGPDIGAAFTALPFDHLVFTGGTAVARHVARAAADNLTPLTLELGGKSPVIISGSADFELAVGRIMAAKTLNAGQICLAPDYVFVPRGHEGELVDAACAAVARMFPTLKENPDYTSIINERHYHRIMGLLSDAKEKGATIVEINPSDEDFSQQSAHRIPPTLVLNTTAEMRIRHEEIFGPALPVLSYDRIDDVIDLINADARPLALYYFGQDAAEEKHILDATTSGAVTINDCVSHVAVEDLPFGGIGDSGMGNYHGKWGFLSFSHPKAIFRQTDRQEGDALVRPPYGEPVRQFLETTISGR
ncbi:coniferyl aldehyde dehydrogenase [Sphingobium lactosutens]|uniref:Aldehyde dehydrogenase n=1 Tax=Sphingobium lactosutens DS20 TaxID=1331060 RepID=T0HPJ0_9SPHN|nr:aldehyde dehydrogenase family protein [Sphingobium lactosutens]EQB14942.1 hypothetical protein RLDS_12285 [Sphingobium lactosutens DS20]